MTIDQIKRALIAKTKNKTNMPDWYYSRLEKCIGCKFNSSNIDKLSFKDRIRLSHNFGKDACTICTCGVEDKCSDGEESCPKGEWNTQAQFEKGLLNVQCNSKEVTFELKDSVYELNYGVIKKGANTNTEVVIKDKGLRHLDVKPACGCTSTTTRNTEDGIALMISYDSTRMGPFDKSIYLNYLKEDKIEKRTIIKIAGTVTN
jgi:hypothetical protein